MQTYRESEAAKRPSNQTKTQVQVVEDGTARARTDRLATEEPLQIRLDFDGGAETVATTMRTPGNDFELAVGFLYGEGVVRGPGDVSSIRYCVDRDIAEDQRYNIVTVELTGASTPDLKGLERHFYVNSSCGVCGKAHVDALEETGCSPLPETPHLRASDIYELPHRLRAAQRVFESTGGLHAAALFTATGELVATREDVGRHNALDKLVGWSLLNDLVPLHEHVLMVSGRASFEILQKALVAQIPIVCAVSAPSSLAVSVAQRFGMTLVGFLRGQRFNIYAGAERIEV